MREIASEGWGEIQFENIYHEDYFTTRALNDGLKKVYGTELMTFKYSVLDCKGKYDLNKCDTIKLLSGVQDNSINISTFNSMKNEFTTLLNNFKQILPNTLSTGALKSNDLEINYFDFTKFDNIICGSSISRTYNFLNSQLFNYDVNLQELCYDYHIISSKITVDNLELIIDFSLTNEYNERVEYIIKINK